VKSNNENKIVTTRLVKAKDGERRIKKALKIQEMRQPVLKERRKKAR